MYNKENNHTKCRQGAAAAAVFRSRTHNKLMVQFISAVKSAYIFVSNR